MKQRVITAVIALIIFIPIIIAGGIWIDIAALVLGAVALSEVLIMKKKLLVSPEAIFSGLAVLLLISPDGWFSNLPGHLSATYLVYLLILLLLLRTVMSKNRFTFDDAAVITLGLLYIGTGFHYFIAARDTSLAMLFYALFTVWITDSGAYMIGRKLGKHKLAPAISLTKLGKALLGEQWQL